MQSGVGRTDSWGDAEADAPGEIDSSRLWSALSRKRWWVIAPTLLALIGAAAFVNLVKPRYSAEARLLLENQESFITRADKGERVSETAPDAEAVQSQIQLLTSRDLARRVIKTLELQGNEEFDPLAKGMGALTRALVALGISRDPTRLSPEDRILESFADKLAVLSPTKTRVLSVEFTSRNPDLAASGANVVADSYIEMVQEAKRDNARVAANSLRSLVEDLRNRVNDAEAKAEEFRSGAGLLVGSNNATINTQQLGDLANQLSISHTAQADSQAKAEILREMLKQNRVGEIPDVANNEFMRRIGEQRVTLRAQLALEMRTLLPGHPRIKELEAQLAALDAQWRAAAERTARTLENDARIAGSRVANLQRALDAQKKVAGAAGAEEVRMHELDRASKALKEQLEMQTAKYQEALAREGSKATPADARVIQRALAPQIPSFPKKLPITAFATIATLLLTVGAILAGELLSVRASAVRPQRTHEAAPGSGYAQYSAPRAEPTLTAAPAHSGAAEAKPDVAPPLAAEAAEAATLEAPPTLEQFAPPADPQNAAAASETAIHAPEADVLGKIDAARMNAPSVKVLLAHCDGAAKASATALTLGRALARRGLALIATADANDDRLERVVVDAPARARGLVDLMTGAAGFGEVIHLDRETRLHIVPAGSGAWEVQYDSAMIVEALAQTYDFVVFATGGIESAQHLAPLFDMVLVQGGEPEADVWREALAQGGANVSVLEDRAEDELAA
jgi:succinoglycan biosynthesis transport protein ExoP